MSEVQIDVWSDYVCPFCYLAEPPLAQAEREASGTVQIRWRAFELRPEPEPTLDPRGDYLRDIWARAVYPMARERGMNLQLPPVQPRSRLAHEAAAFASDHGRGSAMQHAIFRAFFEQGADIGQVGVLMRIAGEIGLDPAALSTTLATGTQRARVLEDEAMAQSFGLSGVPAIVVRRAGADWREGVLVEGAQPYSVIRDAIEQVKRHREAV